MKYYNLQLMYTFVWTISQEFSFYPSDAMLARVIAIATCPTTVRLCVCLSVRHALVLCQNEKS